MFYFDHYEPGFFFQGPKFYILDDTQVIECHDIHQWNQWMDDPVNRFVGFNCSADGIADVSTVFLGFCLAWLGSTPILFETRVFGGIFDDHAKKYSTWQDAVEGHQKITGIVNSFSQN